MDVHDMVLMHPVEVVRGYITKPSDHLANRRMGCETARKLRHRIESGVSDIVDGQVWILIRDDAMGCK